MMFFRSGIVFRLTDSFIFRIFRDISSQSRFAYLSRVRLLYSILADAAGWGRERINPSNPLPHTHTPSSFSGVYTCGNCTRVSKVFKLDLPCTRDGTTEGLPPNQLRRGNTDSISFDIYTRC